MKSTLDYRDGHLCIVNASKPGGHGPGGGSETIREWFAVRNAAEAEVAPLVGRPLKRVEPGEGLYVDEEGNVYQLPDKGETKPIAVEQLAGGEKSELEVLLEASLKDGKGHEQNGYSKRVHRRMRNNARKAERAPQVVRTAHQSAGPSVSPCTDDA